jgi:hypothetical protein
MPMPYSISNPIKVADQGHRQCGHTSQPKMLLTLCFAATLAIALPGCTQINSAEYLKNEPKFNLKQYFSGPIKAWGIVQNRSGQVIQQFDIAMVGTWNGNLGTLVEDFSFYDGKKQRRIWTISDKGNGLYEGRAEDILGTATGLTFGNAGQWTYTMDVPVKDGIYRMKFDDWMWAMNDGVLMNRSYMKKFGITFAEITIFMQKQ